MSGADYILAINLTVAGLLAASFAMVAAYDKTNAAARWIAASYLLGMAYFGCEALIPLIGDSRFSVPVAFGTFLAAMVAFNVGLARSYRVAAPWRLMGVLFAVSIIVVYLIQDLPRQSIARMMLYQSPYALMQVVGIGTILVSRTRRPLDLALAGLLAASSAAVPEQALPGPGARRLGRQSASLPRQRLRHDFAVAWLGLRHSDRADDAGHPGQRHSRRCDAEVRNRHAVRSAQPARLRGARRNGGARCCAARHRHVAGDLRHRPLQGCQRFARPRLGRPCHRRLRRLPEKCSRQHHAAGRIGGEEFAVILPGANLLAARLFAEGARSAFASLPVDGLPQDRRFTASFGVAELAPGESIADLLVRADCSSL